MSKPQKKRKKAKVSKSLQPMSKSEQAKVKANAKAKAAKSKSIKSKKLPPTSSSKSNHQLHPKSKSPSKSRARSKSPKSTSKPHYKNKHAPNAKDEYFANALKRAPNLKQYMQAEGIWIQELFEILVVDNNITNEKQIGEKITSNEQFDDIVRNVKLRRAESNKDADQLKRLDRTMMKFEKLWRSMTGIKRKNKSVKTSKPKGKLSPIAAATHKRVTSAPPKSPLPAKPNSKPNAKPPPQSITTSASNTTTAPKKPKVTPKSPEPAKKLPVVKKTPKSPPPAYTPPANGTLITLSENVKARELEQDAISYVGEADKLAENKLFRQAIKFYSFGIVSLQKTLHFIKKDKEKRQRIQQIDGYKGRKSQCQYTLIRDKKQRREHEKKGMEYCLLAEEYEKKRAYDVAVKYYEKGLPLLVKSIENLDHKLSNQYKCNKISRYKSNLRKCQQYAQSASSKKKHGKTNSTMSRKSSSPELIGNLFDYIGEGNVDVGILSKVNLQDLYLSLPILISSMSHIPLSFKQCFRDKLVKKLNTIIESSPALEQRLRCYLFSYSFDKNIYLNFSLKSIYRYHPCMPQLAYNVFDEHKDGNNADDEKKVTADFESYYLERDCISFFRSLSKNISLSSKLGNKFFGLQILKRVDEDVAIYDLWGHGVELTSVEIQKVFKSNAKPVLIKGIVDEQNTYHAAYGSAMNLSFILKAGDDLRRDDAILNMFRLLNYFFKKHGLKYNKTYDVQCLVYSVCPMGPDFGAIEFIPDCVTIGDIAKLAKDDKIKQIVDAKKSKDNNFLCKLVSTAAAAYIASFVCGIRDRHYDNILIRKSDGSLFHIDFNYLWQKVNFLDAAKLAITKDFKEFLGEDHWNGFVSIACKAYLIIRKHFNEIIAFSNILFDFMDIPHQQYLYNQLRIYMDDEMAEQYITKKLQNAPYNFKTRLKNAMHRIATT